MIVLFSLLQIYGYEVKYLSGRAAYLLQCLYYNVMVPFRVRVHVRLRADNCKLGAGEGADVVH